MQPASTHLREKNAYTLKLNLKYILDALSCGRATIQALNDYIKKEYTSKNQTYLDVSHLSLTASQIKNICWVLFKNIQITTLNLSGNTMNEESVTALGIMLQQNTTLTHLMLEQTSLNDILINILGMYAYRNISLLSVDLQNNKLTNQSIFIIGCIIRSNISHPNIKNIVWLLDNNPISFSKEQIGGMLVEALWDNGKKRREEANRLTFQKRHTPSCTVISIPINNTPKKESVSQLTSQERPNAPPLLFGFNKRHLALAMPCLAIGAMATSLLVHHYIRNTP